MLYYSEYIANFINYIKKEAFMVTRLRNVPEVEIQELRLAKEELALVNILVGEHDFSEDIAKRIVEEASPEELDEMRWKYS